MDEDDDTRPPTTLRVSINGEPYCDGEDFTTITMAVDEVSRRAERRITLYASGGDGHLKWMTADLTAGDQIVIEIVDAAAERRSEPPHCDFCGRDVFEARTLLHGTTGSICDVCIMEFSTAVHRAGPLPIGASFRGAPALPCRFCGKEPPAIEGVVMRNGAAICAECLRTSADLLSDRSDR